ncbi:hypothetical protein R2R35_17915 [Anaerocolumna sp. AGMB13020]|uniref:hypothetical protein n=1 Tax=Anaerocolumna sp. AGMB13020 TaxID=3081750 RepID=UPI002953B841|nr:hypothetical protein [Anaerocolumna sp. AGMB13020]WOO35660.1 hypothetical protein R2R35_17915 [Anaerocolumna sp. AGMB13020]
MGDINIRVRKEVIKCKKCGNPKSFFYLSDFAYGQRLIFLKDATKYAFINLIEDIYFLDYTNMVKEILSENSIDFTNETLDDIVNETYGITCDLIDECVVDFSQTQKKCNVCHSTEFERNLIEPESLIEIEVPVISHNRWEVMSRDERKEIVKKELISKNKILLI